MLLSEITALRGPSGWEDEARNAIRNEAGTILEGREGRIYGDTIGNLYVYRKGTDAHAPHVMLAAHMDEVGFIVRFADEDGQLRIDSVGGVDARCVVSKRVIVGEKAVPGVIGIKAIHLMSDADRKKAPDYDSIFIDIGAKSKEEAERLCPPGSYATFESEYREFGDGFVKAKALDDRAGCMILLDILRESDYSGDITCVFTVQEEVGLRGARVAARKVRPDKAIILDTTTANDMGMVDSHKQVTRCGEGPALTFMDRRAIIPEKMRTMALDAAKKRGIPVQIKRGNSGGTDAGEIHLCGEGVESLVIVIPCRYCHSGVSVCKLDDIENAKKLAFAVLEDMQTC
ncbi:MAG: M20/M25/M40 family metallo-hydrolase [Clostridia bacterium]|nr:M20/M25/M40 family metallo-hydrolase [Clostridia bacterium]